MGRNIAITRISPLSAFRVGLAVSLVGLVAWLIAVTVVYFVMATFGVWEYINGFMYGLGAGMLIDYGLVLSLSALVGAVAAILATILAPLFALIYNAVAALFGGIQVDLQQIVEVDE